MQSSLIRCQTLSIREAPYVRVLFYAAKQLCTTVHLRHWKLSHPALPQAYPNSNNFPSPSASLIREVGGGEGSTNSNHYPMASLRSSLPNGYSSPSATSGLFQHVVGPSSSMPNFASSLSCFSIAACFSTRERLPTPKQISLTLSCKLSCSDVRGCLVLPPLLPPGRVMETQVLAAAPVGHRQLCLLQRWAVPRSELSFRMTSLLKSSFFHISP